MSLLSECYNNLMKNNMFKVLIIVIVMDIVFGVLRAIREKKINSTVGIDGMIRKTGMLLSVIFTAMIDVVINFNLIGFIPEDIKGALKLDYIGFHEMSPLLYIIFEFLSISTNMVLCKLPIPAKWQKTLENFFKKFTGELDKTYDLKVIVEEKKDEKKGD